MASSSYPLDVLTLIEKAEAAFDDDLEQCIHLYLLNRGIMITPFHNMMLVCPQTSQEDATRLAQGLDAFLTELNAEQG